MIFLNSRSGNFWQICVCDTYADLTHAIFRCQPVSHKKIQHRENRIRFHKIWRRFYCNFCCSSVCVLTLCTCTIDLWDKISNISTFGLFAVLVCVVCAFFLSCYIVIQLRYFRLLRPSFIPQLLTFRLLHFTPLHRKWLRRKPVLSLPPPLAQPPHCVLTLVMSFASVM